MILKLSEVLTTAGTQIRASIDSNTVDEYAQAMQDATQKFPPVVVFHDGNRYILADGFHRVMAASRNGFLDIEADVRKGTKADALRFALGANAVHGLKRTNADKRRSVELALAEWPKLSNRELAKLCAVSDPFVGEVRQLLTVSSSDTRIGADGKERKLPRKPEPKPTPQFRDANPGTPARPEAEKSAKSSGAAVADAALASRPLQPEPPRVHAGPEPSHWAAYLDALDVMTADFETMREGATVESLELGVIDDHEQQVRVYLKALRQLRKDLQ